jgi:hypothetical protein
MHGYMCISVCSSMHPALAVLTCQRQSADLSTPHQACLAQCCAVSSHSVLTLHRKVRNLHDIFFKPQLSHLLRWGNACRLVCCIAVCTALLTGCRYAQSLPGFALVSRQVVLRQLLQCCACCCIIVHICPCINWYENYSGVRF